MGLTSWVAQGRMGNFLWTAATVYAYCLEHKLEFSAPNKTSSDYWSPLYCKHLIRPDMPEYFVPHVRINEKHFHYAPLEFNEEWRGKNILFNGYFQSIHYISNYRDEIIKGLNFPYKKIDDTCSIHARFGDYLTIHGKHIIVDEDYLIKAINLIKEKTGVTKFKVFSDDINYFKTKFSHLYDFEYSSNKNEVDDLVEASSCAHNICSSSTFSFWIAFLNKNEEKVVVFQKKWFQDGWKDEFNRDVITSDLLPENWIRI